jgi:hypothetical protein
MKKATEYIPATAKQVSYLHGLYRSLCWDKDQYQFVLSNDYGVDSTKDLSISQAHELICLLANVVKADEINRVTPKQLTLIRANWLVIDYSKGANGDDHLNAFVQKRFKKASVDRLSKTEATKLIKMISQMTKQAESRKGKTTVLKKLASCIYCHTTIMWVQLPNEERVCFDVVRKPGGDYEATNFHECKARR